MGSRAAERRRAKEALSRALSRLTPEDRMIVLEDAVYEATQATRRAARRRLPVATEPETPAVAEKPGEPQHTWQRIEAYCLAHPTADGVFDSTEVGTALFPDKPAAAARTIVYITVRRKSAASDRGKPRNPRFEFLEGGKFRLLSNPKGQRRLAAVT